MSSYIEFNGVKSNELGLKLLNDFEFISPRRDVQEVKVIGRHGTIEIDNGSYNEIIKTFKFVININGNPKNSSDGTLLFNKALEISKWLNVKGYKIFRYSMYPGYYFRAKVIDEYNIRDTVRKLGKGILKFKFYPIMYKENQSEMTIVSGNRMNNECSLEAYPLITITVSRPTQVVIYNNGKKWIGLNNVSNNAIIDSREMQVIVDNNIGYDKMEVNNPLFPRLEVGNNTITFSNPAISSVKIFPRYGEVAI